VAEHVEPRAVRLPARHFVGGTGPLDGSDGYDHGLAPDSFDVSYAIETWSRRFGAFARSRRREAGGKPGSRDDGRVVFLDLDGKQ